MSRAAGRAGKARAAARIISAVCMERPIGRQEPARLEIMRDMQMLLLIRKKARSRVTTTVSRPGNGLPIDWKVFRPMINGRPQVISRKRLRSLGARQEWHCLAERPVAGDGDDDGQRQEALAHIATGALIAGRGR